MEFCKRIGFSLIRIWLGYMWLVSGIEKFGSDKWVGRNSGSEITRFLQEAIARSTGDHPGVFPWYANAAQNFGIPHAQSLSLLFTWCEVALGITLLFGVFTTFSACVGCIINLTYLFGNESGLNPVMYTMALLVVVTGSAASYYGLDRHLIPSLRQATLHTIRSIRVFLVHTERV